jgi:hypothetical protein
MILRMKKTVLLFLALLMSGCWSASTRDLSTTTEPPVRAVYLAYGQMELSAQDLQAHPEVIVVHTFDDFKNHASRKTALWIDKSATPLDAEQEKWINEGPQAYYPIVLVGYSDILYSFRDLLKLCCFMGPATDAKPELGFSIIQWEAASEPDSRTAIFLQGYSQTPTVDAILEITNALLEGRLQPSPAVTEVPAATAAYGP